MNRLVIVNGPTKYKYIKICLLWIAKQLTAVQFQTVTGLKVWSFFLWIFTNHDNSQFNHFPSGIKDLILKKKEKKRKKGFEIGFWGSKIYILYIFLENEGLVETEFNCYSIQSSKCRDCQKNCSRLPLSPPLALRIFQTSNAPSSWCCYHCDSHPVYNFWRDKQYLGSFIHHHLCCVAVARIGFWLLGLLQGTAGGAPEQDNVLHALCVNQSKQ